MQLIGVLSPTVCTESERQVRRYRDEVKLYRSIAKAAIALCIALLALCIALCAKIYFMNEEYSDSMKSINSLATELDTANNSLEQLQENYDVLVEASEEFQTVIDELDSENAKVVKANKTLRKRLNKLESRSELFDKYEYALYDKLGNRTDLTYDQVATGEELMVDNGMDPDLLFGIIMTESGGDEMASNSESTARGYGQLLEGTGQMVYENIQGHGSGTYSHSKAYDGDTNIAMMVSLLNWFRTSKNYSLNTSIKKYRGVDDISGYVAKINSYIGTTGNSISKIAANW